MMIAPVVAIFLLSIVLNVVNADRDIVASAVVCATFPNEEFAIDLARCQNTCEFYGRTWDCPISYKPNGDCYCKEGFARLEDDGECVSVTNNAACVAKLPITPETCVGPNEIYTEFQEMNVCDNNCRTYGCKRDSPRDFKEYKWSPHCICGENDQLYTSKYNNFRRLGNGMCVLVSDPQCIAEFQPSPERCAALGQVYTVNAPCQQVCYGEPYCPPQEGACICPQNKYALATKASYYTSQLMFYGSNNEYQYYQNVQHDFSVIQCYSKASCPATVWAPSPM